jgi:hypothetical protein
LIQSKARERRGCLSCDIGADDSARQLARLAMFKENVGTLDRALRIAAGVGLLSLVFIGPKTWWGLIGLIPLITGFAKTCPAYSLIGANTCARKDTSA